MRAGPLSDARVTQLLNSHFVPIYVSNEDYRDPRKTPEVERKLYQEVFATAKQLGLSQGTVHVYLFSPQGELLNSLHVKHAENTEVLLRALKEHAAKFPTVPGGPLVPPQPQFPVPEQGPDQLLIHSVVRVKPGDNFWTGIAEDWIHLEREEWQELLPNDLAASDAAWEVSESLRRKLFTYIYPPSGNFITESHTFYADQLVCRIVERSNEGLLIALDGQFEMDHDFLKPDEHRVKTQVVGYVRYNPQGKTPPVVRMATFSATYAEGRFDHMFATIAPADPKGQ